MGELAHPAETRDDHLWTLVAISLLFMGLTAFLLFMWGDLAKRCGS